MPFRSSLARLASSTRLAYLAAVLAGICYLAQVIVYAHTSLSNLDEGAYLYKGMLFASGQYWPYQEYGPWTNHMPLSFLIPGATQVLFAPGLRSGRYLVIVIGLLLLLGVWLVARRLGGKWWAAAAVAVLALNSVLITAYSLVVSQILIACLLAWALVFTLGEDRPTWQLSLGAALAGISVATRENLLPMFPILLGYIFWQHGWRRGAWAAFAGTLTLGLLHAIFWSGILSVWAGWIPIALLDPWRVNAGGVAIWNPVVSLESRLYSFTQGLRTSFIPLVSMACFAPLVLRKKQWSSSTNWKMATFLSLLFGVLFIGHAWAALGKEYCVFCFSGYLMFFSFISLFLIVIVNQSVQLGRAGLYAGLVILLLLFVSTLVGFGNYQEMGQGLLELPLPRLSGGRIQEGSAPLFAYLESLFHMEYQDARRLIPALAGFLVALLLILGILIGYSKLKPGKAGKQSLGLVLTNVFLGLGIILAPTPILTPVSEIERCSVDVLATYEQVGSYLRRSVPPGSHVYWEGGLSVAPMLYLPQVSLYLPQINDGYSFRLGGDTQKLSRWGFWNEELRDRWLAEADFILIEEKSYNPDWKKFLEAGQFQELERTVPINPCTKRTGIRIFRRIRD